ncbi:MULTISPECIES: FMN-binding protein [Arthrobacter]|nr:MULTISPECIES: FMN-binding protein [Arthrobacter]
MTPSHKTMLFAAASLTLASAACAPAADDGASADPESAPPAAGSAVRTGNYADGEYSAQGSYIPPSNQTEEVDVTLTLEGNVVTSLDVQTSGNNPTSKQYQREFTSGIQEQVVGKNLDELDVDKVAGSSLTSSGFNKALDAIRTEAAS